MPTMSRRVRSTSAFPANTESNMPEEKMVTAAIVTTHRQNRSARKAVRAAPNSKPKTPADPRYPAISGVIPRSASARNEGRTLPNMARSKPSDIRTANDSTITQILIERERVDGDMGTPLVDGVNEPGHVQAN